MSIIGTPNNRISSQILHLQYWGKGGGVHNDIVAKSHVVVHMHPIACHNFQETMPLGDALMEF